MKRKSLAPWSIKKGQHLTLTDTNKSRVAIYKATILKVCVE